MIFAMGISTGLESQVATAQQCNSKKVDEPRARQFAMDLNFHTFVHLLQWGDGFFVEKVWELRERFDMKI